MGGGGGQLGRPGAGLCRAPAAPAGKLVGTPTPAETPLPQPPHGRGRGGRCRRAEAPQHGGLPRRQGPSRPRGPRWATSPLPERADTAPGRRDAGAAGGSHPADTAGEPPSWTARRVVIDRTPAHEKKKQHGSATVGSTGGDRPPGRPSTLFRSPGGCAGGAHPGFVSNSGRAWGGPPLPTRTRRGRAAGRPRSQLWPRARPFLRRGRADERAISGALVQWSCPSPLPPRHALGWHLVWMMKRVRRDVTADVHRRSEERRHSFVSPAHLSCQAGGAHGALHADGRPPANRACRVEAPAVGLARRECTGLRPRPANEAVGWWRCQVGRGAPAGRASAPSCASDYPAERASSSRVRHGVAGGASPRVA